MTTSLILGCVWIVVANVIGMMPSKRNHWPQAYALIAAGIPLLGYITYENGPWWGLAALFAGASILRWPLRFLAAWVRAKAAGGGAEQ
ncbi:MAG: DUF2484 family protein [Rhodospirillaceae bacterium]